MRKIPSRNSGCGIRSVSFKGNILTIGTGGAPHLGTASTCVPPGIGLMLFWDLRACKFLESTMNSNRAVTLKASRGWVVSTLHGLLNDHFTTALVGCRLFINYFLPPVNM